MILTYCPGAGEWRAERCAANCPGTHYSIFLAGASVATALNELARLAAESARATYRELTARATRL